MIFFHLTASDNEQQLGTRTIMTGAEVGVGTTYEVSTLCWALCQLSRTVTHSVSPQLIQMTKLRPREAPPTDGASSQLVSRKMAAQEKQGSSVRACLVPSWTGAGHDCSGC